MDKFKPLHDYLKTWFLESDFEILKRDYGLKTDSVEARLKLFEEKFQRQVQNCKEVNQK